MDYRIAFAVALSLGFALPGIGQTTNPEVVQSIGARYRDTEERLGQMVHFTWRFDAPESTTTQGREAWLDPSGVARKVTTEEAESHGVTSQAYYLDEGGLYFLLKRAERESNDPKGMTVVDEERLYFDGGRLVRHLTKRASFKPGEEIDTAQAKNSTQPLPSDDGGFKAYTSEATGIVEGLRGSLNASSPSEKPSKPSATDGIVIVKPSPSFRLIEGSASPDGHLALAWAPGKSPRIDWPKFAQGDGTYLADDEDALVNYLVETPGGRIVSTLAGKHFGDKASYNHFDASVLWSPNSKWVLQLLNRKWATQSAHLYCLLPKDKVAGPLNLAATASGLAYAHLRKANHAAVARFGTEFAITLYDAEWKDDGFLSLRVLGQIPKSEEEDSVFELALELAFAVDGNGQIEARQKSIRTVE
jgi:hypothetical protein